MASVSNLANGGTPIGLPLTNLIHMEVRNGKSVPVIEKALVELTSPAFKYFSEKRKHWANTDAGMDPGPIQFRNSPTANRIPRTVQLDQEIGDPKKAHDFDLGTPRIIELSTD